jgi:hypothetical protein
MHITVLGIDLGKNSCSVVGLDASGRVILRRRLQRQGVVRLAAGLPSCTMAMEACCGAHHLGRTLREQGHTVRLMSPEYVRPYVKAQKNDDRDAEAIAEAATRPTMVGSSASDRRAEERDAAGHAEPIDGGSIEVEAQFGQQFGRQRHQEATLALVWRSREITLPATRASINFAIGEGLSYALSRPTFEGLENDQQPRKFLNYLAFEAEVSHPALPGISLVPRLHHRSGIFGLIAPQGTGSNILGLGLRITLQ